MFIFFTFQIAAKLQQQAQGGNPEGSFYILTVTTF